MKCKLRVKTNHTLTLYITVTSLPNVIKTETANLTGRDHSVSWVSLRTVNQILFESFQLSIANYLLVSCGVYVFDWISSLLFLSCVYVCSLCPFDVYACVSWISFPKKRVQDSAKPPTPPPTTQEKEKKRRKKRNKCLCLLFLLFFFSPPPPPPPPPPSSPSSSSPSPPLEIG